MICAKAADVVSNRAKQKVGKVKDTLEKNTWLITVKIPLLDLNCSVSLFSKPYAK